MSKTVFFLLLCILLQNGSKDVPNFLHECTDFEGWSYKLTPVRPSIPYSLRLSVSLCGVFWPFVQNGSKDNFENNMVHCLSQAVFLKKILILDYRGLSVQKSCFLTSLSFSSNFSKDLPNFLQEGRGQ